MPAPITTRRTVTTASVETPRRGGERMLSGEELAGRRTEPGTENGGPCGEELGEDGGDSFAGRGEPLEIGAAGGGATSGKGRVIIAPRGSVAGGDEPVIGGDEPEGGGGIEP